VIYFFLSLESKIFSILADEDIIWQNEPAERAKIDPCSAKLSTEWIKSPVSKNIRGALSPLLIYLKVFLELYSSFCWL